MNGFTINSDIYIELDGKRVAVVRDYTLKSHTIVLERLYITDSAIKDGVTFYDMDNFSLVIVKPNKKIYYTGCHWNRRYRDPALVGYVALEKVTIVAAARSEVEV